MKKLSIVFLTILMAFSFSSLQSAPKTVNINTADLKTLTTLKRIGPAYAKKIIEYRTVNGPFKKREEIQNVSGIGGKTFENNKERIIVSEPGVTQNDKSNGKKEDTAALN